MSYFTCNHGLISSSLSNAYHRYRGNNITDGRIDERTDGRHENIMPSEPPTGGGWVEA